MSFSIYIRIYIYIYIYIYDYVFVRIDDVYNILFQIHIAHDEILRRYRSLLSLLFSFSLDSMASNPSNSMPKSHPSSTPSIDRPHSDQPYKESYTPLASAANKSISSQDSKSIFELDSVQSIAWPEEWIEAAHRNLFEQSIQLWQRLTTGE